jgi:hypothetical protein
MTGKDAAKSAPATKPQAAAGSNHGVGGMTQVPKSEGTSRASASAAGAGVKQQQQTSTGNLGGAKQPTNAGQAGNGAHPQPSEK